MYSASAVFIHIMIYRYIMIVTPLTFFHSTLAVLFLFRVETSLEQNGRKKNRF